MKKILLIFLLTAAALFCGCELNPDDYVLLSPEEICGVLKRTFGDEFTLVSSKAKNEDTLNKEIEFKLTAKKTGSEIITAIQSYVYDSKTEVIKEVFKTDYISIRTIAGEKTEIENLLKEQVGETVDYKFFYSDDEDAVPVMQVIDEYGLYENELEKILEGNVFGKYVIVFDYDIKDIPSENKQLYSVCAQIAAKKTVAGIIIFDSTVDINALTEDVAFSEEFLDNYSENENIFTFGE